MVELKLSEAVVMKHVVDALSQVVSSVQIFCGDKGLTLQAVDHDCHALALVQLNKEGFETYALQEAVAVNLDLDMVLEMFAAAKKDDSLTIKIDHQRLVATFDLVSKSRDRFANYDFVVCAARMELFELRGPGYENCVTMSSRKFVDICRNLSVLGETLRIEVSKEYIQFSSDSGRGMIGTLTLKHTESAKKRFSTRSARPRSEDEVLVQGHSTHTTPFFPLTTKLDKDDDKDEGVSIDCRNPTDLFFCSRHLSKFAAAVPLSDVVILSVGSRRPLRVSFQFEHGHANFYLAPKTIVG